jgi:16S rRNA (guanine(966)-N(2))-methyltransferase RsmD
MRIIRGNHKGKKIVAPSNLTIRPTTDFAKEGLFNILENYFYFDGVTVADIFAGTGNISYEFAARGAEKVIAVDVLDASVNFINRTAQLLNFEKLTALKMDALAFLDRNRQAVNIIFADPPYDWKQHHRIPELVFDRNLLLPNGFLIIEHDASVDFKTHPKLYQHRKFGKVNFSIFAENL